MDHGVVNREYQGPSMKLRACVLCGCAASVIRRRPARMLASTSPYSGHLILIWDPIAWNYRSLSSRTKKHHLPVRYNCVWILGVKGEHCLRVDDRMGRIERHRFLSLEITEKRSLLLKLHTGIRIYFRLESMAESWIKRRYEDLPSVQLSALQIRY